MIAAALLLLALAGVAKSAVDILTHQPDNNTLSARGGWFDARLSWKLKYKDYDKGDLRPRFLGSKTWLVSLTDFWHAADAVYLLTYGGGNLLLGAAAVMLPFPLIKGLALFAVGRLLFGVCFEFFYQKVWRKRPVA